MESNTDSLGWRKWLLSESYKYINYSTETVVIDKGEQKIVSCPTEEEAVEFIRAMEGVDVNAD